MLFGLPGPLGRCRSGFAFQPVVARLPEGFIPWRPTAYSLQPDDDRLAPGGKLPLATTLVVGMTLAKSGEDRHTGQEQDRRISACSAVSAVKSCSRRGMKNPVGTGRQAAACHYMGSREGT